MPTADGLRAQQEAQAEQGGRAGKRAPRESTYPYSMGTTMVRIDPRINDQTQPTAKDLEGGALQAVCLRLVAAGGVVAIRVSMGFIARTRKDRNEKK